MIKPRSLRAVPHIAIDLPNPGDDISPDSHRFLNGTDPCNEIVFSHSFYPASDRSASGVAINILAVEQCCMSD